MKNQMLKYSLYDYIKEYKTHKDEIDAVIFNKSIEHYNNGDNGQILGMTMSIFIVAFLLSLGLWKKDQKIFLQKENAPWLFLQMTI